MKINYQKALKLVKRWFLESYYSLHYYQDLVDKHGVYHDRGRFRRLVGHLSRYSLCQYRRLYPSQDEESSVQSLDLSIPPNPHLTFIKYFFLFYSLRCFAIIFLPFTTQTLEARLWMDTEYLGTDSAYIETTIALWSLIAYLFHQITLTDNLLDYAFLALFRMSDRPSLYIHPQALGLTPEQFTKFRVFRSGAMVYYHFIMGTIVTSGLLVKGGLFYTRVLFLAPLRGALWFFVVLYLVFIVCAVIYGNLVAFTVVAMYVAIKQKAASESLKESLLDRSSH